MNENRSFQVDRSMSRDAFTKVAAQIEKDGFDKGYKQAVKDVKREFLAVLDRLAISNVSLTAADNKGPAPKRGPRADSDQARVLKTIHENPGLRGIDIVQRLAEGDNPVNERTVRTALNRLKARERIMSSNGRWYSGTLVVEPVKTIGQH